MDESAAAVIGEDGAEKNCSHNADRPCENNHPPSTEDSGDGKYPVTSRNFHIDFGPSQASFTRWTFFTNHWSMEA